MFFKKSKVAVAYQKFATTRFPLPTVDQLNAFEGQIGIALPLHYRTFLLSYNGGYFRSPHLAFSAEGFPDDSLNVLYGFNATVPGANVDAQSNLTIFEDNYPAQIVAIGYTTIGNLILLVTRDEDFGSIIVKRAYHDMYARVADNMEDFFGLLE